MGEMERGMIGEIGRGMMGKGMEERSMNESGRMLEEPGACKCCLV